MSKQEALIQQGVIHTWHEKKGYGFIRHHSGDYFFHIRAFHYHHRRPQVGDEVAFILAEQGEKRFAERVLLWEHRASIHENEAYDRHDVSPFIVETIIYVFLDALYFIILSFIFFPLAVSGFIISIMTFYLFWRDKHAARLGKFRVPEHTLYLASMLGGWPGALIARQLFRHKINNSHFIVFFWASIVIHFSIIYTMIFYVPFVSFLHPN